MIRLRGIVGFFLLSSFGGRDFLGALEASEVSVSRGLLEVVESEEDSFGFSVDSDIVKTGAV